VQSPTAAVTTETTRGGYQIGVDPSTYILCAKTVCATVTIPTGIVELSAVDAASGLTWDAPVAVPPAQTIGPLRLRQLNPSARSSRAARATISSSAGAYSQAS
jgi:hypothetical protein